MSTRTDESGLSPSEGRLRRLVAVGLACLLLAPVLAGLLGVEARSFENRKLARFPALTPTRFFDPANVDALTQALTDRLRLREQFIRARAWALVHLLGDSPSPDVHIGRDGWLFYDLTFTRACEGMDTPRGVVRQLRRVSEIIAASGREVVVMIVPDKNAIYPDQLGPAERFTGCARTNRQVMQTILDRRPPLGYVDLWQRLRDRRAEGDAPLLYIPTDTHWTTLGAAEMAEIVVDRVAPGFWQPQELQLRRQQRMVGDLTRMMGLREKVAVDHYRVIRKGVRVEKLSATDRGLVGMRVYAARSEDPARVVNKRVFFLHDSFMYNGMNHFTPFFEESAFSHWQTAGRSYGLAMEMRDADVVVLEIAERGTYNWVHKVFPDDAMLEQLERILGRRPGLPGTKS